MNSSVYKWKQDSRRQRKDVAEQDIYLETAFMCNPFTKTCPNHSDHLFWDSIHPSEAAYNYIGNFVDAQIRGWIKA